MKIFKSRIFIFLLGMFISSSITVFAVIKINSVDVIYHDDDNVKDALDDVYTKYSGLHSSYEVLQGDYAELQTTYQGLQSNYSSLQTNYSTLQTNYNNLRALADTSSATIALKCSSLNGNTCSVNAVVGKVYFCISNTRQGVGSTTSVSGAQVLYSAEDGSMLDYSYSTFRFFVKATSTTLTFAISGAQGMDTVCYSIINTK